MISVIIPVLNEAGRLGGLLRSLSNQTEQMEVIVVDGGSDDGSADIAANFNARVTISRKGRGQQLAAGAAVSRGEVLLFLHVDTRLPPGALTAMRWELEAHPNAPGGNFCLLFDGDGRFDRRLEGFYHGAWTLSAPGAEGGLAIRVSEAAIGAELGRPIRLAIDGRLDRMQLVEQRLSCRRC